MALSRTATYLLFYNVGMAAGWSYAFYLGVKGALDTEFSASLAGCMPSAGSVVGMIRISAAERGDGFATRPTNLTRNSTRPTTLM